MKHIKKKYQFESLKLPIKEGATPSFVNRSDSETLKEINKDTVPLIQTTDGSYIWGCITIITEPKPLSHFLI